MLRKYRGSYRSKEALATDYDLTRLSKDQQYDLLICNAFLTYHSRNVALFQTYGACAQQKTAEYLFQACAEVQRLLDLDYQISTGTDQKHRKQDLENRYRSDGSSV